MAADAVAIADAVVAMKKAAVAAEAKKAKKKAKAADAAVAVVAVTNRISYTYYNKSRESSFAAFIYIYRCLSNSRTLLFVRHNIKN